MLLTCRYQKTLYRNEYTGETVCNVLPDKRPDDYFKRFITVKGEMLRFTPETPLIIEGDFDKDKRYFLAADIKINCNDVLNMKQYIKICLPSGIGEATADKITELIMKKEISFEDYIHSYPEEELKNIKPFTPEKVTLFLNRAVSQIEIYKIFHLYSKYGISLTEAKNIYKTHGGEAAKRIEENPYPVLAMCKIPFTKTDAIAASLNIPFHHPSRIRAITNIVIHNISECGESYVSFKELIKNIKAFEAQYSAYREKIPVAEMAMELIKSYRAEIFEKNEDTRIYPAKVLEAEKYITESIKGACKASQDFISLEKIEEELKKDTMMDNEQKAAVKNICLNTAPSILVGKPGTGKTTTIKKIVEVITKNRPDAVISLAAPTGRAAERISESSGLPASTIHTLLEFTQLYGEDISPQRGENNKLDEDIIIIDEMSMVGIFLFEKLLKAMKPGCKLIMVGDWNQLPSIEPGTVLYDLAACGKVGTYFLNTIHRQKENGQSIVRNAHNLLGGDKTLIQDKYFKILSFSDKREAMETCIRLFMDEYRDDDLNHIHIIAPQIMGYLGVEHINQSIQEQMFLKTEPCIYYRDYVFHRGDKVMTLKNRYDNGCSYYNGDIWCVTEILPDTGMRLDNGRNNILLPLEQMDEVKPAYAMTLHKCQGSEGDVIILMLSDDVPRNLTYGSILYTAITRARERIIILNVNGTLEDYLKAPFLKKRTSSLSEFLE